MRKEIHGLFDGLLPVQPGRSYPFPASVSGNVLRNGAASHHPFERKFLAGQLAARRTKDPIGPLAPVHGPVNRIVAISSPRLLRRAGFK